MASQFFSTLESVIKSEGATLVKKVNGIYQFDIDGTSYSVDLKNGSGSFKIGKNEKPECTITIKEEDFVQILEGKLTEQTAFMKKKLSIKGNMALAMKFKHIVEAVKKAKTAAPAATTTSTPSSGSSLEDGTPLGKVFETLSKTVTAKPELVGQIKGVYQFDINTASGVKKFTVDLKNGKGSVSTGAAPKADCTITMAEADFLNLMSGKLNGQTAFTKGLLKIKGNMGLAMKLGKITAAKPSAKL